MINMLELRNFKAFEELSINISPITFLLGPNNSGKSAIIAALRLLFQTIDSNDRLVPLLLNGRFGDFGTYRDVVHGNHRGRPIKIGIGFTSSDRRDDTRRTSTVFSRDLEGNVRLDLDFKYRTRRREIILRSCELRIGGHVRLSTHYSEESERQLLERVGKTEVPTPIKSTVSRALRMQNFVPFLAPHFALGSSKRDSATQEFISEEIEDEFRALQKIARAIANDLQSIEYVGPLRASPSRTYLFTGERRRRIGLRGENAINLIAMDKQRRSSRIEPIVNAISTWLTKAEIGAALDINPLSDRHYEIRVQHPVTKESQNLADIGYGISQVLPVLVGGYSLDADSTYLIEEPEIHLHPRAQAELGTFFRDLYYRGINTIVETHSEHLILRMQQYVAQGSIPPDDIRVLYVYPTSVGKVVKTLRLDDKGRFIDDWPEGFFPERLEEAKRLSKIRKG